jgi:HTH-type transcriptional regulator/antitoxin HigA
MTTRTRSKAQGSLPRSFEELNEYLPLFAIHDDGAYERAQQVADQLAGRNDLTRGQERYLETLSLLMEEYESERHAIDTSRLDPIDALGYLLERHGMSGSDLGELLGQRQLGAKILSRKRELSKAHIVKLARYFRVSPALLLGKA